MDLCRGGKDAGAQAQESCDIDGGTHDDGGQSFRSMNR